MGARAFFIAMKDRERRVSTLTEMRAVEQDNAPTKIVGYAARFNSLSQELPLWFDSFQEQIAPGAFKRAIDEQQDVRALFNHDANYVIGRTRAGTLSLKEDANGLWIEVTPPDTQWARDLVTSIERGDISQMSFAFSVIKDQWDKSVKPPIRTLMDVDLFDVSPVTYPAYEDTQVSARALTMAKAAAEGQAPQVSGDGGQADAERARMRLRIAEHE